MLMTMSKALLYGSVLIFSTIGSYMPVLWHAGFFSFSSIIGGIVGTIVGIWAAIKINDYVDF
jgi:ABC-type lipoprotein release transport system permease subunit